MSALFRNAQLLQRISGVVFGVARKNICTSYAVMAKLDKNADPIQRLFAEKIQVYIKQSSKDGKPIGVTPEMEAETAREMDQIKKRFGGGNLEEFPKFNFADK